MGAADDRLLRELGPLCHACSASLLAALESQAAEILDAACLTARHTITSEIKEAAHSILGLSESLGANRGREWDETANAEREAAREALFQQLRTKTVEALVRADPARPQAEIQQAADAVVHAAEAAAVLEEDRAERHYLQADVSATLLYRLLQDPINNGSRICSVLESLEPQARQRTLELFQERYDQDFLQAVKSNYASLWCRLKSFLSLSSIWRAAQERWGLDIGIWKEILDKLDPTIAEGWAGLLNRRTWKAKLMRTWQSFFVGRTAPQLSRLQAILHGDKLTAAGDALFLALREKRGRVGVISDRLLTINKKETEAVEADFERRYAKVLGGMSLRSYLLSPELFPREEDREYLGARLDADDDRADAIFFCGKLRAHQRAEHSWMKSALMRLWPGGGPWRAGVVQLLVNLSRSEASKIEGFKEAYRRQYGAELSRTYLGQYLKGPLLDWAAHLFAGEFIQSEAARLRCSLAGLTREWAGIVFNDTPRQHDEQIVDEYRRMYGRDFFSDYQARRGEDRTNIMRSFIQTGKLTLAEQVRHCLAGWGADSAGLRACLGGRTAAEIRELDAQYSAKFKRFSFRPKQVAHALKSAWRESTAAGRHSFFGSFTQSFKRHLLVGRKLTRDLKLELSAHSYFDICRLREGTPKDPAAKIEQFSRRYRFEHAGRRVPSDEPSRRNRGAIPSLAAKVLPKPHLDEVSKSKTAEELLRFYKERIAGRTPRPDELRRFDILLRLAEQDLDFHRQRRQATANIVSNLTSLGISIAAFKALVDFGMSYWPVALGIAGTSFAARAVTKIALKGGGYGRHEALVDGLVALSEGATMSIGRWIKTASLFRVLRYGRVPASIAVKTALKQGFNASRPTLDALFLHDRASEAFADYAEALSMELGDVMRILDREMGSFSRVDEVSRVFTRLRGPDRDAIHPQ